MEEFKRLMLLIFLWNAIHTVEGFDNLSSLPAYKGHASQSRTYSGYNAPADRAVDGYLQEERENTCSITLAKPEFKAAWWKFSLKRMSNIAYLEIYFRRSTVNRHVGFSVFVFNDSSYIPPSNAFQHKVFIHNTSTCLERVTTVTVNRESQGIALYNSKEPPVNTSCAGYEPAFATIEICEVKVMGCPSQHYGENCTSCDPKCRDRHCEAFNGSCIYGCSNTVIESSDCSECVDGYYGNDCIQRCGFCKNNVRCNKTNGICPEGCQGNWNTLKCNVCKKGYYGQSCELNCGKCSIGTFCDNITGICPEECQDRWNGSLCDECGAGFYGQTCENTCGNCKTGTYCNASTGICPDGCKNHWDGLICKVCKKGYYGQSCELNCGKCSIGTFCDNITGICPEGCQDHWTGFLCDACEEGFYGQTCEKTCGSCKKGTHCNTSTGICPDGCENHWDGLMCKACPDGFYGAACELNCGKCSNGSFCDNVTGICSQGCQDHWNGSSCDDCVAGFYGQTCENFCGNCGNGTYCNTSSGICPDGCEDQWDGLMCNECKNGYYGLKCEGRCGYCENGTYCDKVNGTCPGESHGNWNGSKCDDFRIWKTLFFIISGVSTFLAITLIIVCLRILHTRRKSHVQYLNRKTLFMVGNIHDYDRITATNNRYTYNNVDSTLQRNRHTYDLVDSTTEDPDYLEIHL